MAAMASSCGATNPRRTCHGSTGSARVDHALPGSTAAAAPAAGSMPSLKRGSGRRWQESAGSWRDVGEEARDRARRAGGRRARAAPLDAGGGGQGDARFGAVSSGVRLPGRAAAEQQTRGPADPAAGPGRLPSLVEEAPQPIGECGVKPYYSEDGITIYHADCRDVMPSLAPESVTL